MPLLPDSPYQTLASVSLYLMGATASPWRGQPSRWTSLRMKKITTHTDNNTQKLRQGKQGKTFSFGHSVLVTNMLTQVICEQGPRDSFSHIDSSSCYDHTMWPG